MRVLTAVLMLPLRKFAFQDKLNSKVGFLFHFVLSRKPKKQEPHG